MVKATDDKEVLTMRNESRPTRIGIFYDGVFFSRGSNYFNYCHERRARIRIGGLHELICAEVATSQGSDPRDCQVVEAHYFRGRLAASEADARDLLLRERKFDDVLAREGILTHYSEMTSRGEKGVDVALALQVFECASAGKLDICVLITGDGDFLPLVRKLKAASVRVMVVGWDFEDTDDRGIAHQTFTSRGLLREAHHQLILTNLVQDETRMEDPLVKGLFMDSRGHARGSSFAGQHVSPSRADGGEQMPQDEEVRLGVIHSLKEGFGFIDPFDERENVFFFHRDVEGSTFDELEPGTQVQFTMGVNHVGACARHVSVLLLNEWHVTSPSETLHSQHQ
jgi:cold shock CspA family protein